MKKSSHAVVIALKRALIAQLLADEEAALQAVTEAANTARAAAAHEEMKPENDKDTRALEAGYLASGQSARAAALALSVRALADASPRAFSGEERSGIYALIDVVDLDDDKRSRYFVAPAGGGKRLTHTGSTVVVLTPGSPLGDALLDRRVGDTVEVTIAGKLRSLELIALA